MKILHICNHFYPCKGGIERYIEDLCINLTKAGHTNDVVCLDTCAYSKEKLKESEKYKGIRIFRIPYLNLKYYKIAPQVLKFFSGYDILHVHGLGFFADYIPFMKFLHRKPVVLSTHGGIFHTKRLAKIKKIYFKTWIRIVTKLADVVIAESKNNEKMLNPICKPISVPYSFYYNHYSVKKKPNPKDFLFVGRLSRNKRIDNLISTMSELKKLGKKTKLHIIGGDWEGIKKNLKEQAKRMGVEKEIVFVGEVSEKELLDYYSKCKFFISASEYEGFGLSAVEGMAAGCVVILNDIFSFRNFVDGNNGFIADFSDSKKAAKEIADIMNRKNLKKVAEKGKKTAKSYDWGESAKKMIDVYKSLL